MIKNFYDLLDKKLDEVADYDKKQDYDLFGDYSLFDKIVGEEICIFKKDRKKEKFRKDLTLDEIDRLLDKLQKVMKNINIKTIKNSEIEDKIDYCYQIYSKTFLKEPTRRERKWTQKEMVKAQIREFIHKRKRKMNRELVRLAYVQCAVEIISKLWNKADERGVKLINLAEIEKSKHITVYFKDNKKLNAEKRLKNT